MARSLKSPAVIHLHPTAPLAERVLLPGDPGRALALAQSLLAQPLMFNHNRGLWGYTGEAPDGQPLTIQATGMGGPSAAIVLSELIALGARRAIRVGTCGALDPELGLGGLVIARESICADGTSRALNRDRARVSADQSLTDALVHGEPAARYFPRPDVRFIPLAGSPAVVSVVTREADRRPAVLAFRRAARANADRNFLGT